jgi:hypothetical protein
MVDTNHIRKGIGFYTAQKNTGSSWLNVHVGFSESRIHFTFERKREEEEEEEEESPHFTYSLRVLISS